MIQWMHTLSKSWMATLLMGGLTLSFIVWGIADVFNGGTTGAVASVGSTDIGPQEFERTYRNLLRSQSQRTGTDITPEMAEKMGLGRVALDQMIIRAALANEADKLGLTTSDGAVAQSVRAIPQFRGTLGQFDRPTFMQTISNAGFSEDQFLSEIRRDMSRDQMTQAVEGNFVVPPTYAQAIFQYINERRAADYLVLTPAQAGDVPAPSEAVLAAYVKTHSGRYSTPEYRDADFAAIAPADVMDTITVTDALIQQEYDARKATYVVAEKRDVQQIEFKTEAEAKAARAKLASGTSYEDLAAQQGLKPEQISLGTLALDELPDVERAKAIFALALNQVSEPIKTGFGGFVLARVTKIAPGSTKMLADVKDDIRKDLAGRLAANKLVDVINAYTDTRSSGGDLAQAAKKAGMKAARLNAVDAMGAKPDGSKADVPADPEFLPGLFKSEVGDNGDPFQTKLGAYYVIHVNGVTPPKIKPLDQVRAQALTDWTDEQRSRLLATTAQAMASQAAKDKSLETIAKQLKLSVQHSPALTRVTDDARFPAAIVGKLFSTPAGGVDFGPQGTSGNYVIARVTGVSHPQYNPQDPNFGNAVMQFSQSMAQDFSIALSNAARTRQGVKVNQKLLATATGAGQ
jgi:peptidyl-prolyl cis-trans isomerase D